VFRAFLSLLDSWTAKDATNHAETEKAAHAFIDQHGAKLKLSPFDMARFDFNARLLSVARAASENEQQTLAIRLLSLMASGSDILHDLNGRALRYRGRVPELLKKEIEKYTAQVQDDDSIDWIALLTLAGCYERLGNFCRRLLHLFVWRYRRAKEHASAHDVVRRDAHRAGHRPAGSFKGARRAVSQGVPAA
jgi:hypothetical protein